MEQKEFNEQIEQLKNTVKSETLAEITAKVNEYRAEVKKSDEAVAEIRVIAEGWEKRAKDLEVEMATQKKFSAKAEVKDGLEVKLNDVANDLKELASTKNRTHASVAFDVKAFDTKAAGSMLLANYTGGTYGLTQMDPGFATPGRRAPYLREIVRVFPVNSKYITWVEMINRDGGAGNTAEAAAKTLSDFDYVEATKQVEKITSYMKASKESLDDIPRLQSDIQSELIELIQLKLDADLYSGSGTTPVIKGITTYAPTLSLTGTPFAVAGGGIKSANRMDIIRVAAWNVQNNYFNASHVVLNSVDAAQMELVKDTNGQYVIPPFYSANGGLIAGLKVVVNNGVTAGTFLVGDFSKSNLGIREDINISIGHDADDFTKNMVTILAEARAVHYIKANHVNAFVVGTFATLITAANV